MEVYLALELDLLVVAVGVVPLGQAGFAPANWLHTLASLSRPIGKVAEEANVLAILNENKRQHGCGAGCPRVVSLPRCALGCCGRDVRDGIGEEVGRLKRMAPGYGGTGVRVD